MKGVVSYLISSRLWSWTSRHLKLTDNSVAYGVFNDGSDIATSICELTITQVSREKWVKLLRLRLRPSIDEKIFAHNPDGIRNALDAYLSCVLGVFHLKNKHKASIIKVYGRTQEQMSFLTLLSSEMSKRQDVTFKSSIEGRWLVLNWS